MLDLAIAHSNVGKPRHAWGTQNMVDMGSTANPVSIRNDFRQQRVRHKIATFISRAIFPQQITVPRAYATTRIGTTIYKMLEGRMIDGYKEPGVRVVVQENKKNARFVISPLFGSTHDALSWAVNQMGAEI